MDAEDPFRGLDVNYTRLLGFEIANHILTYITRATYSDNVVRFTVILSSLPKKNHLLHILVVMSLEQFIAEYVSQKQPIKTKLPSTVSSLFSGW